MNLEGTAKILEHPFNEKNESFLNKFKRVHEHSYNEYSDLEDELVIEINPIFVKIWQYMGNKPYIFKYYRYSSNQRNIFKSIIEIL